MNTLHFKYAVEVEKARSITQAADNLFMAQPNLSKAIKELEDTLGVSIFERTSKGVVPTEKGSEFLMYAKSILLQLDKMESIYIPKNTERQTFKISMPRGSYISNGFTNFVSELDIEKEIDVHIQETNSLQTITNIADKNFNLGIIRYHNVHESYFLDYLTEKNLSHDLIWEFEYVVLMSKNHRLANVEKIRYSDLEDSIEIVHGDIVIPYLPIKEIKKPLGYENEHLKKRIYVYERCSQFDMLAHMSNIYMWVSPIPEELLKRYDLVQRKCEIPNNSSKDVLIYTKDYKLSTLDKKFINKLYEAKKAVSVKEYT